MDIVVANSGTNNIGILLSKIDGTFLNQQTYPTGIYSRPYSVVVNDFNNDNYLDIAVANYGTNNIGIFLGYGNGSFASQKLFSTGSSHPLFIATDDFNKDNRSDIAVANYGTNNIGVFLGYGDGSFQNQITSFTGYDSLLYSLAVGDFNEDNHLDIAIANYDIDIIGIFLGYGNGSFQSQNTYTTDYGSNPSSIAVADFNDDNHLDIVFANNGTGNVGTLLGFGNGTFAAQTTYLININSHLQYITIGDFNKDGKLDVAVVDSENDELYFLLGSGNGTFATVTTYDAISESYPISIAVADFDKDNQSDIFVANYGTNNVLVLNGYTSEPSARQKNYYCGLSSQPGSVAISNFNNDNHIDIAATGIVNNGIFVLTVYGNETFGGELGFSTGNNSLPQQLCGNDLNNDNRTDVVTANIGSDSVSVLLGQDNGTFAPVMTYSTGIGSTPRRLAIADVNNDNRLDIITANEGTDSVGILLGYGDGSFATVLTFSTAIGSRPYAVAVGDVNNDEHLDILSANHDSNSISILFGDGNGTFSKLAVFLISYNSGPSSINLADFNSDNCLDIAITNGVGGNLCVFLGYGNGSFGTQMTYPFGPNSQPYYAVIADFNHDNRYDIAVPFFGNDEVVIFFGYGNGSFQVARTFFTGSASQPHGIAVADFNNDTQLEIVVSLTGTHEIAILTQYFAANFSNQITYSTGSAPQAYSIAMADFNHDNRSDIVVANSGTDDLNISFGLGNGTFESQMIYSTGIDSHPQYVITGDINNDNNLDIIVVNSKHDSIGTIMGYGNGTFATETVYPTGTNSHPSAVVLGDFNNDNRSDLLVVNTDTDSLAMFIGFDYALFKTPVTYGSIENLGPQAIVTSDFNNDNYLDIAAAFFNSGTVGILLGYGNGSFDDMMTYPQENDSILAALAVDDVNNDDKLDIVVVDYGTNNIVILLGYGNGSFATSMIFSTGNDSRPYAIVIADFNKDGRLDVAVANFESNNVGILLGYSNGSFATVMTYPTGGGSNPVAIAVSDFNKDDRLDIAVVNDGTSNIGILLGFGNGSFANQVTYSEHSDYFPCSIVVSDLTGNSLLDIIIANQHSNSISVFLGHGDGTFSLTVTQSTGSGTTPTYVTVGDFNNDNRSDIAVVNDGANNVLVYFGFEHGIFYEGMPYSTGTGSSPISLAIGDFNNDNRLDFATTNFWTNDIGVFLGYGNAPFGGITPYSIAPGSQPYAAAIGDFNHDGQSDIVIANYGANDVGVLLGGSGGIFTNIKLYSTGTGSAPCSVAVGDFNDDNHLDIVVANCETDNLVILLGFGNGTFATEAMYSTGDRSHPQSIAVADFDNDNIMDIAVANSGTSNILLFYGYGNGTFGNEESHPLGYNYLPYSIAVNDLNQDGWMDIVIACYNTDNVEILMKMC
jgi:hypothetical protein